MNKKGVQIGVIATGVISALILIVYLPVIIWSPPWSQYGYYNDAQVNSSALTAFFKVSEEKFTTYIIKPEDVCLIPLDIISKIDNVFLLDKESNTVIKIDGHIMIFSVNGKEEVHTKLYNPFTIWRIKWLEWTQ